MPSTSRPRDRATRRAGAILALVLPLLASASVPTAAAAADATDATAEMLGAVNALRASSGLSPLRAEPALAAVAGRWAAAASAGGAVGVDGVDPMEVTRQIRQAGYRPHLWRQRLVQGPRDADAVLRHWRDSDPATYTQVVLGEYEVLGAARAVAAEPPLWALFVAQPYGTWERRSARPLDDLDAVRATILAQVNAARGAAGLPPVSADSRLAAAAQDYAGDMLARGFYDHRSPEGGSPADRVGAAGYRYRWVAENLAKGLFPHDEVVDRWLGSSGHRRNILDPWATEVGIGVRWGEERGDVVALWVLLLAHPR